MRKFTKDLTVFITVMGVLAMGSPAHGGADGPLPDLTPLAPPHVLIDPQTPGQLRFTTVVANLGPGFLDLLADPTVDPQTAAVTWPAEQCVAWLQQTLSELPLCTERVSVGSFVWHPDHRHWHFDDFARYELRRLKGGRADLSPRGLVVASPKVSFCLEDTQPLSFTDPAPSNPLYGFCPVALIQGISPGWADVYGWSLEGQSLPVTGIRDGRYALVTTVDPGHRLFEVTRENNATSVIIELSGDGTQVAVISHQGHSQVFSG